MQSNVYLNSSFKLAHGVFDFDYKVYVQKAKIHWLCVYRYVIVFDNID